MRILSLSFPLPGSCIDNYNFLNAPSFFDYDAIVVDPRAISELIADVAARGIEHMTYSGEVIVDDATSVAGVKLSELLHNRRDETERLLIHGGVVVCLAVPNELGQDVTEPPDRYFWLPTSGELRYEPPFMRRGGGREFGELKTAHPFGAMLSKVKSRLAYQVYFDDRDARLRDTVIARSLGAAPIGVVFGVQGGTVALIPPPARPLDSQSRYQVSEALQQAVRQLADLPSASSPPKWLSDYSLPGLEERLMQQKAARKALDEAGAVLNQATTPVEELTRFQTLLWEQGARLRDAVNAALGLLGFRVLTEPASKAELTDHDGSRKSLLLEVESSLEDVGIDGHFRLRQRIEEGLASGSSPRGIIFVNGYIRTAPYERQQQFSNELKLASQQMRYCVATTCQLFNAVAASLRGDSAAVSQFCSQLFVTEGVLRQD